jgi:hypothetical protein
MEDKLLERKVECLRLHMIELANESDSLLDAKVIQVSQKLDELLVKLQRIRMANVLKKSQPFAH